MSSVPLFATLDEFRAYVQNGFKDGPGSVPAAAASSSSPASSAAGAISTRAYVSPREMRARQRTAQARREVSLSREVVEGIDVADKIVTDAKVSHALASIPPRASNIASRHQTPKKPAATHARDGPGASSGGGRGGESKRRAGSSKKNKENSSRGPGSRRAVASRAQRPIACIISICNIIASAVAACCAV